MLVLKGTVRGWKCDGSDERKNQRVQGKLSEVEIEQTPLDAGALRVFAQSDYEAGCRRPRPYGPRIRREVGELGALVPVRGARGRLRPPPGTRPGLLPGNSVRERARTNG